MSENPVNQHVDPWQGRRLDSWATLFLAMVAILLSACIVRVIQLKLHPDERLAGAAGSPISSMNETARRGDLFDRHGRLIATTTIGYRAFIDPLEVVDISTIAVDLELLVDLDAITIDRALGPRLHTRFVPVSGILEPWQVDRIRRSDLGGVGLETRLVRHYPHDATAAHLIGDVGFEHTGLGGIEHMLDASLQGRSGHMVYLRDVRRRPLWINPRAYTPPMDGEDRTLTIDMVVQAFAEQRLEAEVLARNASGGRVVVVDPRTGELIALADVVNPNHQTLDGTSEEQPDPGAGNPRLARNRCGTDPYEPGSTFKPFVWASATELRVVTPQEILPTPSGTPHRTKGGRRIRDVHYYGPSSWRKVLVKSMNSGMAIVAERLDHVQMQQTLERFGFGQKTNCGLPGETIGLVTSKSKWTAYTQVSVAMGHEIGVTPLQMARAFSVFASDGSMPTLQLIHSNPGDTVLVKHQVIDPGVAQLTRETLRSVMTEGTGRKCQSDWYQLFGKSGTAQLPRAEGGGYHEDRYVSSFIAGAPLHSPRLVVICVIEDPDKTIGPYYGGLVAGPVVRDVMDHALAYLGTPPDIEGAEGLPDLLVDGSR